MDDRSNADVNVAGRPNDPDRASEPFAGEFERTFEVTINGLVPPALLAELGEVEVSSQEMRTVLSGHFRDQSEVYGFLQRLRVYALEVIEVRRITSPEPADTHTDGS
ncbi:MAG: hypothetical protein ACJ72A_21810 [Nocardioidaceae bacterium]|jgi:hypothetical protein